MPRTLLNPMPGATHPRAARQRSRLLTRGCWLALALGLLVVAPESSARSPLKQSPLARAATSGALSRARVHIVEFTDYQCPYCGRVQATLKRLEEAYGAELRVTVLHNPLGFHQEARPAALAALAAHKQRKFKRLHTLLFERQRSLPEDGMLEKVAGDARLNLRRFNADRASEAVAAELKLHQDMATALGARGTPTFFINGVKLAGAQPYEKFAAMIDEEIAASKEAGERGPRWIEARSRAQNPRLVEWLWDGQRPVAEEEGPAPKPVDPTVWAATVAPGDPARGPADALVTVVTLSDFQCPFCKRLEPTLEEVRARYEGKVRLVFKHNPLPFHRRAEPAAAATICAGEQGRFWELHDLLFEHQRQLEDPELEAWAEAAGVELVAWRTCLGSSRVAEVIERDQQLAVDLEARGTPTSFINGRKLVGAQPLNAFVALVDEELGKAEKLVAQGVRPGELYDHITGEGKVFEPLERERQDLETEGAPRLGGARAPLEVVVFSDFQCPHCKRAAAGLSELVAAYGGQVSVVFKHLPLSMHREARAAATAAECAREQQRFWPMHDLLFERQDDLAAAPWSSWAVELGMDRMAFEACLVSGRAERRIAADEDLATRVEVRGTPSLFFNGRRLVKARGYGVPSFRAVIERAKLGVRPAIRGPNGKPQPGLK